MAVPTQAYETHQNDSNHSTSHRLGLIPKIIGHNRSTGPFDILYFVSTTSNIKRFAVVCDRDELECSRLKSKKRSTTGFCSVTR